MAFWFFDLPEFPWPEHLKPTATDNFLPPAAAVQEYLEGFCEKFHLHEYIQFLTEVVSIERATGKAQWLQYGSSE